MQDNAEQGYKHAYDLHYKKKDYEGALSAYLDVIEQSPEAQECSYAKTQIDNIIGSGADFSAMAGVVDRYNQLIGNFADRLENTLNAKAAEVERFRAIGEEADQKARQRQEALAHRAELAECAAEIDLLQTQLRPFYERSSPKWEYLIVKDIGQNELNEMGALGWELVSCTSYEIGRTLVGIDGWPNALADHRFASERLDQKLVVEIIGELKGLMLIASARAAVDIALGVGNLDAAKPCWLFEIRALVKVDCSLTERLRRRDRPFGAVCGTFRHPIPRNSINHSNPNTIRTCDFFDVGGTVSGKILRNWQTVPDSDEMSFVAGPKG